MLEGRNMVRVLSLYMCHIASIVLHHIAFLDEFYDVRITELKICKSVRPDAHV